MTIKIKHYDNKGFFGEGYYEATITKVEPIATTYGRRLMIWYQIQNEHGRTMSLNHIVHPKFSSGNTMGKITKILFPDQALNYFESDQIIKKRIGVVVRKKIKKTKSYLNIVNYLPLKKPEKPEKKTSEMSLEEIGALIGTLISEHPEVAKHIHKRRQGEQEHKKKPEPKENKQSLGAIIKNDNDNPGNQRKKKS